MSISETEFRAMQERCERLKKSGKKRHENTDHHNSGLRPAAAKPVARMPLEDARRPEEAHWYDDARRFEIRVIVYSILPADYDGYDNKACQDFCVKIGILPEDRWDVLFGGCLSRKASTKEEEKTEVQIIALRD
jgi:hypothetical protein